MTKKFIAIIKLSISSILKLHLIYEYGRFSKPQLLYHDFYKYEVTEKVGFDLLSVIVSCCLFSIPLVIRHKKMLDCSNTRNINICYSI